MWKMLEIRQNVALLCFLKIEFPSDGFREQCFGFSVRCGDAGYKRVIEIFRPYRRVVQHEFEPGRGACWRRAAICTEDVPVVQGLPAHAYRGGVLRQLCTENRNLWQVSERTTWNRTNLFAWTRINFRCFSRQFIATCGAWNLPTQFYYLSSY